MKIEPAVQAETKKIAVGTAILTVLMIAVFLVLRQFDWRVLTGAALGYLATVGNFFAMAMTVQGVTNSMPVLPRQEQDENGEADEQAEEKKNAPLSDEAKQAGKKMQASFVIRMLLIGAIAAVAVTQTQLFNPWAALLPLLFPNILITLRRFTGNDQKEA